MRDNEVIMLDDMPIKWLDLCQKCVDAATLLLEQRRWTVPQIKKNMMIVINTADKLREILKEKIEGEK